MSGLLKVTIVDAASGEVTERPLTAEEIADREVMQVETEARQAEATAKVDARARALTKIAEITGLTPEEIASL